MGFIDKYPYTDFHELNLDWVLRKIRELGIRMDDFEAINEITFSGAWNITSQYPAWTVVTDNNLGYISIKPVPAGITLTNTEYWVLMVDYTAELAGIHSDILALQNGLSQLNQKFDRRYTVEDRYFIIGSDSYGSINYSQWVSKLAAILGKTGNYIDCSQDGGSFTEVGPLRWLTILQTRTASMTTDEKKAVTDIVFMGGINDSKPYAEFTQLDNPTDVTVELYTEECILEFADYCKANFPNALITLAFIGNTVQQTDRRKYPEVARSIWAWQVAAGMRNNIRIIDNMQYIMHDYMYMSGDDIHPTTNGGDALARRIASALMGGDAMFDCDFPERYAQLKSVGSSTEIHSDITAINVAGDPRARITNNIVDIFFGREIGVTFNNNATAITVNNGDSICIGELQYKEVVYGKGLVSFPVDVVYWDRHEGGTSGHEGAKFSHARLRIEQGCLYLDVYSVSTDFLVSSANLTQMSVLAPHIVYNTMLN